MDGNVQQVTLALQGTLQLDPNIRKQAENRIFEFEKVSGEGLQRFFFNLFAPDEAVPEIRMAAAGETPEVDMTPEEEEQIRQSILQGMFLIRGTLQGQLSHAVQLMAKVQRDFPERWPTLVPSLAEHLKVDDLGRLVAALSAMDQLFKKFRYESKSTALWTELKSCLLTVQEPLTQVYAKMIEFIPQRSTMSSESLTQWLEILCLVCKVFHSLCFQDLPEYFEDNLKPWVEGFLEIMKMDCPGISSSAGEATFLDELKMEVCEIFTLYAQRFEEEINPFMQNIIQAVWQLVVQTGAPLLTARVVPVGSLLNNLVAGFDKDPKAQNSPYLMKAVLRCVASLMKDEPAARHRATTPRATSLPSVACSNKESADRSTITLFHSYFREQVVSIKKTFFKNTRPELVMRDHGALVMQHFSRLVGSKSLDQYGFQMANAILPVVEMVQGVENPMSVLLNNMFRRVQFSKTPKFMKHFVVFLCRFAIVRGAEHFAKSVEAIQTGMFRMLLEKVVVAELPSLHNMTTLDDKRIIAIGVANMLADATNYVGDQYGPLAIGTAQLIEAPSASDRPVLSPEEEQASMYNAEGEFTNPYCRLSYAPRADPLAPEITNFKNYLARAVLQRGPAANSAVESCIPAELRTHLMAYVSL
ncbi:Cse1 [Ostertagia ostertagi]